MYHPGKADTIFFDIHEMFTTFRTNDVFPEDNIMYITRSAPCTNESNDLFLGLRVVIV
jgi:hypothetical protein